MFETHYEKSSWLLLVPPLADCTMPMLGPYVLAGYLKKQKIPTTVCDTSIAFLKNALNPKYIRKCGNQRHLSPEKICFLEKFAVSSRISDIDPLLKFSSATKILSALSKDISFSLDEVRFHFAITTTKKLQRAIELLSWTSVFFEKQPFWKYFVDHFKTNVGISVSYSSQLPFALLLAKLIKNQYPGIKILLGGAYFNNYEIPPTEIVNKFFYIDNIVIGHGETPLFEIATSKQKHDRIIKSVHSDTEYIPDYAGVRWDDYCVDKGHRTIPLSLRTSCYYKKCAFCNGDSDLFSNTAKLGKDALRKIMSQVVKMCHKYRVSHVYFTDAALSPNILSFVASLIQGRFRWGINARMELPFSEAYFSHLHECGCDMIRVGMETSSQRVLDLMKKGTRVEHYLPYFTMATAAGIKLHVYIMFGFPGEQDSDRNKTLHFLNAVKSCIYSYSISIFHAIPDTPIYNELTMRYHLESPNTHIDINKQYYTETSYRNICDYITKACILLSDSYSNRYCYSGRVFQMQPEPESFLLKFQIKWETSQSFAFLKQIFSSGTVYGVSPGKIWKVNIDMSNDVCSVISKKKYMISMSDAIYKTWGVELSSSVTPVLQNNISFSTKE